MKAVQQTLLNENGNCLSACLASILEDDIDRIPNPKHDNWLNEMNNWLIYNHGVFIVTCKFLGGYFPEALTNTYLIGTGKSKSGRMHAVVCFRGEIMHDPWPGGSGLTYDKLEEFDLLVRHYT